MKADKSQQLSPAQRGIAVLLASGMSGREACKQAQVDPTTLVRWKKLPAFRKHLEELLSQSEADALQTLHALRCKAAEKLGELMSSENPVIALKAVETILDKTGNPYAVAKLDLNPIPKEWEQVMNFYNQAQCG